MIDQELVELYIRELQEIRVHGRRFAESYPDIARRLDIGPRASRDPHVERVVESAAFLAARLRLMVVQNLQEFPISLLSMMAPTLVEPIPSMTIIQLQGGRESQHVARDTRFEYQIGGQTQVCFSTTMAMTAAPLALRLRRLDTSAVHADGIGVTLAGIPDRRLVLCLGNNETTAATLLDGLSESLAAIELVPAGGGNPISVARSQIRIHGFDPDEAMLPMRPATHQAHRLLTEFMAFPEKFRFVSLSGLPLASGAELRFWFLRPLQLPTPLPPDLVTTNRVPAINLWNASATPFNVDGKRLEYPIRVDACATERWNVIRWRAWTFTARTMIGRCVSIRSSDSATSAARPFAGVRAAVPCRGAARCCCTSRVWTTARSDGRDCSRPRRCSRAIATSRRP